MPYCLLHVCAVEQKMLWDSQHSHNINSMIDATYIMYRFSEKETFFALPQLGVTILADSNSWNMNGTPNLKTMRQMLRVLRQLVSDNVLVQPSLPVSVGLLRTKFQVPNFLFSPPLCLLQPMHLNYRLICVLQSIDHLSHIMFHCLL